MKLEKLKDIIENTSNIVFFGGAGVSTESGIPDFRSAAGMYTENKNVGHSPEYVLSYTCFKKDTEDFFDFYRTKMIYPDAKPNSAHIALAKLEEQGKLKAVITQNVDGLHQSAGSKNVLELHGSVHENYCVKCKKSFELDYIIKFKDLVPLCDKCGGLVRPDVVLYEEGLNMNVLNRARRYIQNADVLIVGGTSLVVYPAAGLLGYYGGEKLILINKSRTQYDKKANLSFNESIGKVLGRVISK